MSLNLIYDRHPLKRLKTSEASEKSNNLQQNDIQYYCILLNLINMDRLKLGICFFGFNWTCSIIIVSKIRAKLRFLRCINTIFLVFLCKAIWNRTDKISYREKHRHTRYETTYRILKSTNFTTYDHSWSTVSFFRKIGYKNCFYCSFFLCLKYHVFYTGHSRI